MQLIPPMKACPFASGNPGDLVLVPAQGEWKIGLISTIPKQNNERVLILLESFVGGYSPCWTKVAPDTLALSYGTNYAFRTDRTARIVASSRDSFGANGALVIGSDSAAIRVAPTSGQSNLYFDLATGESETAWGRASEQIAVLDWVIQLAGALKTDPPFFMFSAP